MASLWWSHNKLLYALNLAIISRNSVYATATVNYLKTNILAGTLRSWVPFRVLYTAGAYSILLFHAAAALAGGLPV